MLAVPLQIADSDLLFVADTGAACSILDRCIYEKLMQEGVLPPLQPCSQRFHAVNGSALPVYGKVPVEFKLGQGYYKHSFIITDMPAYHGIIGLDFMDIYKSVVIVPAGLLWLTRDDNMIQCIRVVDNGVRLVCSERRTVIFPGRELMIPVIRKALLKCPEDDSLGDLMLIEPFPAVAHLFGCLAAAVVADSKGQTTCLSVVNLGLKSIVIPKGAPLGFAFPIDSVRTAETPKTTDCDSVPPLSPPPVVKTRSGRIVKPPDRLDL